VIHEDDFRRSVLKMYRVRLRSEEPEERTHLIQNPLERLGVVLLSGYKRQAES
jgi:hypothetical protein